MATCRSGRRSGGNDATGPHSGPLGREVKSTRDYYLSPTISKTPLGIYRVITVHQNVNFGTTWGGGRHTRPGREIRGISCGEGFNRPLKNSAYGLRTNARLRS